MSPPSYPDIAAHGLIGDLQTAALVATDGTIDWFCCPRFDSPSLFASLLDRERGGSFRIAPADPDAEARQLYLPGTAVLVTRFTSDQGLAEVTDFMPVIIGPATDRHRLIRIARVVRGAMRFVVDLAPRFDYARQPHEVEVTAAGAVMRAGDRSLTLHLAGPDGAEPPAVQQRGTDVHLEVDLSAGQWFGCVLESSGGAPRPVSEAELGQLFDTTVRTWRQWLAGSSYTGRWREMVERSAITLKLMTYGPTGALVAAPTAALPEQLGGERNWDYRYTWVRDASFSVRALLGLGFTAEAAAFLMWLRDRVSQSVGTASGPLKIMYRVDGTSDLVEESLDHFEGYRGSRPVRIGNGAADQLQLDIYGEALAAIHTADAAGLPLGHEGWSELAAMLDWLCDHWSDVEEGIWETRGGRQAFTYGRVMSWTALDRGLRLATERGRPADVDRWRVTRDDVYRWVMTDGWDDGQRAFVQHAGSSVLDSSLLLMPAVGIVSPFEPRWLSTLDAFSTTLVSDSLVYRYDPAASPDGLRGTEGTFSMCSFWYVEALARAGRLDQAQLAFEKMLTYANPLGLYSEEIGITGQQLGNFPQAFSHLALASTAVELDRQLDGRRLAR